MMMKYLTRKTETNGSNIWLYQIRFEVGNFEYKTAAPSPSGFHLEMHYLIIYLTHAIRTQFSATLVPQLATRHNLSMHLTFCMILHVDILEELSASIFGLKVEAAGF